MPAQSQDVDRRRQQVWRAALGRHRDVIIVLMTRRQRAARSRAMTSQLKQAHYLRRNRHKAPQLAGWMPYSKPSQVPKGIPMNDVVTRYLECWNETDPVTRRRLIDKAWAAEAEYIDPLAESRGRAAIDTTIAAVQGQFPGLVFSQAGPVDAHHRQTRFTWGLGPEDGDPLVVGFDVVVIDEEGKITTCSASSTRCPPDRVRGSSAALRLRPSADSAGGGTGTRPGGRGLERLTLCPWTLACRRPPS